MSGGDIGHQSVRKLSSLYDDRLEIGAIGICRQDSPATQIEEEETACRSLAA
jgi:hypothetical protein